MLGSTFVQTGRISKFILRQDRIRIPVWLFSLSLFTIVIAKFFTDLYSDDKEISIAAEMMKNPAMIAMLGPGYGMDRPTIGVLFTFEMLLFTALVVGIMNIMFVVRHTRADEEEGRIEIICSLPVGRLSNLYATIIVSFGTNVLLALIVGFGLYGLGIKSMDLEGSLIYGAALGATGIIFTSITAIFAQLTANSRSTIGFSVSLLLFFYLIRAIGDVSNEYLSWFSPLSWILNSEAYVRDAWWPILMTIGVAFLFVIISFYFSSIRDLGSGFFPSKPGRKHASVFLKGPLGLAFRLQRTGIIAWAVGLLILGISYGSVLGDLETYILNNEMIANMLAQKTGFSLTEQFIPILMKVITIACTIPTLLALLKFKGEEKKNLTDHILSRAVTRTRLMGSYLFISIICAFSMVSLAAIGLGTVGNSVMDNGIPLGTIYGAAIVYLPAIFVMIGMTVCLIGIAPKFTGFIWAYLIYSFFVIYLGGLLQFPKWMEKLTPFGYIPQIPIEDMNFTKVFSLMIIAIVFMIVGFLGFKKRDIIG